VDGTGVDLARLGQGSYAPVRAIGTVRLTGLGTGEQMFWCRARIFPQKAATEGSARGIALSRPPKALASEARS